MCVTSSLQKLLLFITKKIKYIKLIITDMYSEIVKPESAVCSISRIRTNFK